MAAIIQFLEAKPLQVATSYKANRAPDADNFASHLAAAEKTTGPRNEKGDSVQVAIARETPHQNFAAPKDPETQCSVDTQFVETVDFTATNMILGALVVSTEQPELAHHEVAALITAEDSVDTLDISNITLETNLPSDVEVRGDNFTPHNHHIEEAKHVPTDLTLVMPSINPEREKIILAPETREDREEAPLLTLQKTEGNFNTLSIQTHSGDSSDSNSKYRAAPELNLEHAKLPTIIESSKLVDSDAKNHTYIAHIPQTKSDALATLEVTTTALVSLPADTDAIREISAERCDTTEEKLEMQDEASITDQSNIPQPLILAPQTPPVILESTISIATPLAVTHEEASGKFEDNREFPAEVSTNGVSPLYAPRHSKLDSAQAPQTQANTPSEFTATLDFSSLNKDDMPLSKITNINEQEFAKHDAAPASSYSPALSISHISRGDLQFVEISEAPAASAAQQISMSIREAASSGAKQITISLTPEHLGRVELQLDISRDGSVKDIRITAHNIETLDAILRDSAILEQTVREILKSDSDLSFSYRQHDGNQDNFAQQHKQGKGFNQYGKAYMAVTPTARANIIDGTRVDVSI